jgi:hypothetical protein
MTEDTKMETQEILKKDNSSKKGNKCNLLHTPNEETIKSLKEECTGNFKNFEELLADLLKD